ncbi:MAG: DUF4357 domain-containing protein [Gammaproteobacteria bacterium]
MVKGHSIRIEIPYGDPKGLRLVSKGISDIIGVVYPLMWKDESRQHPKVAEVLKKTGVYVVWGTDMREGVQKEDTVYIGEGVLSTRIDACISGKDEVIWTHVAFFTSAIGLDKTWSLHIEDQLFKLAHQAGRCSIRTTKTSSQGDFFGRMDADIFFEEVKIMLSVMGVYFFEKLRHDKEKEIILILKDGHAKGIETPEGFLVLKGSKVVKKSELSDKSFMRFPYMIAAREKLMGECTLENIEGITYQMKDDHLFKSPSTAASVLWGGAINGRDEWKTKDGKTLKEIQEERNKEN